MILNDITEKWVTGFIVRPVAALLVEDNGDFSTGLEVARYVYEHISGESAQPLTILEYEDKRSIGIDDIRELRRSLNLSASSSDAVSRMAVMTGSERLTVEAQNALLKLIEELPERTVICLITDKASRLLPTVRSRCFLIPILPLSGLQITELAHTEGLDVNGVRTVFSMVDGNLTKARQLLRDDASLKAEIESAKLFLRQSVFERQKVLDGFKDSQDKVPLFLRSLLIVAKAGMRHAQNVEAKHRWKHIVREILVVQRLLEANVSTKLALLRLSITI